MTIKETQEMIKKGECTLSDVVAGFKKRIEEREEVNAIISSFDSKMPEKGDLLGSVFVIKDNILVKGERCTAGSKMLDHYRAPFDATVIHKLKEKGAVIIAKANMDEFAMGSSTETSAFGPTRNPLDLSLVPGGSSGGSAAAVADLMCNAALGSDTGGSIRQPASFCGVVGMKPTYGTVSRNGLIAMASSFDQIGPLTRTVEDAEIVFRAISGKDEFDSTTVDAPQKKEGVRIGVPREYFIDGIDKEVKETIEKAMKGLDVVEISLPHTEYALPAYYIIMASEVSSNMARFDGMRYGLEKERPQSQTLLEAYINNRGGYLGEEVKRRIVLGTYSLSSGYYDAYYLQAQKIRKLIFDDFEKAFQKVDVILTPTSPCLPFAIGERVDDPLQMYLADIFTVTANLAGVPAISLPCGEKNGLSVGAQIIAPRFHENSLFKVAKMLEEVWKQ